MESLRSNFKGDLGEARIKPTNTMHASTGRFSEVRLMPPPREFVSVRLPTSIYFEHLDKTQAIQLFEELYIAIAIKWGYKAPEL